MSSMMMRRVPSRAVCSAVPVRQKAYGNRHHSTLSGFQPGFYTQATEDHPIFKFLMRDDEVRNSFLTGILGESVTDSELLDPTFNPMRSFTELREP